MSKAACKQIIDGNGEIKGKLSQLSELLEAQKGSLLAVGLSENASGEKWAEKHAIFRQKANEQLNLLISEAMRLCETQPFDT